jgi:hypothetical protein
MFLPFPDERTNSADAHSTLHNEFDFARRLNRFWLTREKNSYLNNCPLDPRPLGIAVALNVQACREFRTVVELCMRCEGYTAAIVARTLFETALATAFVLLPEIRVRIIQSKPNKWQAVLPGKSRRKSDLLTRELRAMLYIANMKLERYVFATKSENKRGRKQYAKPSAADRRVLAETEMALGKEWTYILTHQRSYSGLSVANLAAAIKHRLDHWYDTIYFFQSRIAHGTAVPESLA